MTEPTSGEQDAVSLSDEQLDKVHGGQAISPKVTTKNALKPTMQSTTGGSIAQGDTIDNNDNLPG